jgi:hypothetical protein
VSRVAYLWFGLTWLYLSVNRDVPAGREIRRIHLGNAGSWIQRPRTEPGSSRTQQSRQMRVEQFGGYLQEQAVNLWSCLAAHQYPACASRSAKALCGRNVEQSVRRGLPEVPESPTLAHPKLYDLVAHHVGLKQARLPSGRHVAWCSVRRVIPV